MLLGEALLEADMPPGALNVIPCPSSRAEKLVAGERIAMLSFTGSPAMGRDLKARCGRKKIALELGGREGVRYAMEEMTEPRILVPDNPA